MIEKTTRILTENLARSINRRTFLRRAGEVTFAGMAALAAGRSLPAFAGAGALTGGSGEPPIPLVPQCSPPGPYCNLNGVNEPNGCHGGSCFQHLNGGSVQQCRVYYTYYQAGCWTTAASGGYWTCCDCRCDNGSTCGCAQFNGSPAPRPDAPGGTVNG
jgi:hypothetical protein